ncbi:3-oxoacyl-ACP reductase [Brachybacterium sacelli]|uniref:3-oxoacyl-[acyl-carrier protein] reductase n=1 Tax=Brachybacterium sacelli TaxID=173364 RepID=A0ABS4X4A6_9MICO|nr:3-oxoacyl-ACP reductase [Brachybacterium sacelli]MBP2383223.1 3-oxoacyl-[acyl-carrier protein] reductase [Brachybacterium sacelli]
MTDAYTKFVRSAPGALLAKRVGLPRPARLPRRGDRPGPVLGPVVVLGESEGADQVAHELLGWGADVRRRFEELRTVGSVILVLDEVSTPADLGRLLLPLAGAMRTLAPGARVVTISRPARGEDPAQDAARGGVEGFLRSLAHEMRAGGTANGILVTDGVGPDAPGVIGTLRFLLSARSAFVTGQLVTVASEAGSLTEDLEQPLAGRTALVTGAARGIGAAIARTLAADGARLVVLDVPGAGTELSRLANELHAVPIQLDVTAQGAGERLVASLRERGLRLDVVVLNAGITRDKLFANMTAERWDPVLAVNIASQIALTDALIEAGAAGAVLGAQPRVVSLSSTSGIAGNRGQTNYAASKAGVIAFVDALAARLESLGGTANAVAPGFIETEMTARMPALTREVARRLNSLQQGGLPADVAEAIAFLSSAEAGGLRGETLRVCGQNMVGR